MYIFSGILTTLGFVLAELTDGEDDWSIFQSISVILVVSGVFLYYLQPEAPLRFSYGHKKAAY